MIACDKDTEVNSTAIPISFACFYALAIPVSITHLMFYYLFNVRKYFLDMVDILLHAVI